MNLLFERVKLQATFKRLYDALGEEATMLIVDAVRREQAMFDKAQQLEQEQRSRIRVP